MQCKAAYYDTDGKLSKAYYNNLVLSPDIAKNQYLKSMLPVLESRFSTGRNINEDFDKFTKRMRDLQDPVTGKFTGKDKSFSSPSNLISKGEIPDEKIRELLVNLKMAEAVKLKFQSSDTTKEEREAIFSKKMRTNPSKYITGENSYLNYKDDFPEAFVKEIEKQVEEEMAADPAQVAREIKSIREDWVNIREGGTKVHEMIEEYVAIRSEWVEKNGSDNIDVMDIINKTFDDSRKTSFSKADKTNEWINFLSSVEEFLQGINFNSNNRYETELPLQDETLKVRGIADLVVMDDKGGIHIFDWKTKSRKGGKSKINVFDSKAMGLVKTEGHDAFNDLHINAKTEAELQTSMYKLILERQFGANRVRTANVVYIDVDIDKTTGEPSNPAINKNINMQSRRKNLIRYFDQTRGININEEYTARTKAVNEVKDLVQSLSGVEDFNEFSDPDAFYRSRVRSAMRQEDDVMADNKGKYFIGIDGERIYWTNFNDFDKMYAQVQTHYESNKHRVNDLADKFIGYFEGKKWPGRGTNDEQVNNMLKGISPETHSLEQVNSLPGMESVSPNILVAINKIDRSAKVFNISHKMYEKLENTENQKVKRTSVFHQFISDFAIQDKYSIVEPLPNEERWHKMVELGLVTMQLHALDYINTVDSLSVGVLTRSENLIKPTTMSMQALLPHIKVLKDIIKEGEIESPEIYKMLDDPLMLNPSEYQVDAVKYVYRFLDDKLGDLVGGRIKTDDVEALKVSIEQYHQGKLNRAELAKEMIQMTTAMAKVMKKRKDSNISREELLENQHYVALSKAVLSLLGYEFNYHYFRQQLTGMDRFRNLSRVADDAVQFMSSKINSTEQVIADKFGRFRAEHQEMVLKLEADADQTSLQRGVKWDSGDYFKTMFVHDNSDAAKKKDPFGTYMLKDPEAKPGNNDYLTPAQRDYIRFFNTKMEEILKLTLSSSQFEKVMKDGSWKANMVPLMRRSKKTALKDIKSTGERTMAKLKHAVNSGHKQQMDDNKFEEIIHEMTSNFDPQFQNPDIRMEKMLGIVPRDEGVDVKPSDDFETNLEYVLSHFVRDSYQKLQYEETLGAYNALTTMLVMEKEFAHVDNESTRKFLDEAIKMLVFNEHKKEGKIGRTGDQVNKLVTFGSLAFSAKQFMLETFTMSVSSVSAIFNQRISGKKMRQFDEAGFAYGLSMVLGDSVKTGFGQKAVSNDKLTGAIINSFALFSADAEGLVRDENLVTRGGSLFQSKWGYSFLLYPHKKVTTAAFIAMMKHDGVLPAITHSKGGIVYNFIEDKRYDGLFNSKGEILKKHLKDGKISENASEDIKDKYALWEYHKKTLAEEGKVDENGNPNFPYTAKNLEAKKETLMNFYGSLDKRGKTLLQFVSFGRLFGKFRSWMAPKIAVYWSKRHPSDYLGKETIINDPETGEKKVIWEPHMQEGIVQTLMHLTKGVHQLMANPDYTFKDWKDLDKGQKTNINRLMSDIIVYSVLYQLFSQLFDDEEDWWKSDGGRMLKMAAESSLADVAIWKMMDGAIAGSPIVALSYMKRLLDNTLNLVSVSATGDVEKGLSYAAKLTGATKSLPLLTPDGWK